MRPTLCFCAETRPISSGIKMGTLYVAERRRNSHADYADRGLAEDTGRVSCPLSTALPCREVVSRLWEHE